MRKAAGGESKRPAEWLRRDVTKRFVEVVASCLEVGAAHVKTKRGGGSASQGCAMSANLFNFPILAHNGQPIADRYEMLALTDMWKLAGCPANRQPYLWIRKEGATFVEAVAIALNLPVGQVLKSQPGRYGRTFAIGR